MTLATTTRRVPQRLTALLAGVSMIVSMMAVYAPPANATAATATVRAGCQDGSFVVDISTHLSTVNVDLDGSGTIESGESDLTGGRHLVTAAVGAIVAFQATAVEGAFFIGDAPAGLITVLDCDGEVPPATGAFIIRKRELNDPPPPDGFGFTGPGGGFVLNAGEHKVFVAVVGVPQTFTENVPDGWRLEKIVCGNEGAPVGTAVVNGSSVTMTLLVPGGVMACTFDNEKNPVPPTTGTVIVEKKAADHPQADFEFTGDLAGTLSHDEKIILEAEIGVIYTSTETVPEGWRLEGIGCDVLNAEGVPDPAAGDFTIDLEDRTVTMSVNEAGAEVECEFDNESDQDIIIRKVVTEGSDTSQEFTFAPVGFALDEDTLAHGEEATAQPDIGTYSISETVVEGWELVSAVCESDQQGDQSTPRSIDLSPNETITCTFTNHEVVEEQPEVGSIEVTKTADVDSVNAPGANVAFTITVENTSTVEVTINTIEDSVFGEIDAASTDLISTTCEVTQTLAPDDGADGSGDDFYSCEFVAFVGGGAGTHTNEVTLSGVDVGGGQVSDVDNEVVTIDEVAGVVIDEVAGIVITPPVAPVTPVTPADVGPADVAAEELPFTGLASDRLIGIPVMLLVIGLFLLRIAPFLEPATKGRHRRRGWGASFWWLRV